MGFILFSSILACRAVMLKGSTVYGRQPVSMAYMFTPLYVGVGSGYEAGDFHYERHNRQ